ncbi:hypothetical protein [Puia dinghuensis]|uniref:Uncharacterized protein n=1 Tax=Puia dinghuensis TaxID=1792502 RepID=A0A8J2XWI1_9BACT|nr:hypothetical protein [Puia dinghuensis]GGB20153.1 hypothetical protein GCM10011511_49870 [Puia dinghuensis]
MKKPLEELSASNLRSLLIEEVKAFVECLDSSATHELEEKRKRLILIFSLITEKEKIEAMPLVWGKNSAKSHDGASSETDLGPV